MTHFARARFAGWTATAFLLIAFSIYFATRPKPIDVLNFPQQIVNSRIHGVPGAVASGSLSVTGTKCVSGGKAVQVTGKRYWQSVRPPGVSIFDGGGSALRQPRCKTQTFENLIPAAVVRANARLAGKGGYAVWRLTGIERPVGAHGVERAWVTQPFRLYVR